MPGTWVTISIGEESFEGRLALESAPQSCLRLRALLPLRGNLIHARWSGESLWAPLGQVWPRTSLLPGEDAIECPQPGEILLYAGEKSEPELLVAYGPTRFACQAGALAGNRVLIIDHNLPRLAELGRKALWQGAMPLRIG